VILAEARARIRRYAPEEAAASLADLGVDTGDLIGGYEAW